jgi:hypothetical protein
VLDLWLANARQDWYSWAIKETTDADHVLVIASEWYRVTVLPPHTDGPDVDLGPPVARPAKDRLRVTNQITGTVTGNVVQADTIVGNITF